ncbi:MAG: hypothetical protein O7H41_04065 [Planctomycetota bacterium]|nr:hypothetical protein [Planctomycetota bacterium]
MSKGKTGKGRSGGKVAMNPQAVARIQSATAQKSGGGVPKASFAARAQRAAAKNSGTRK